VSGARGQRNGDQPRRSMTFTTVHSVQRDELGISGQQRSAVVGGSGDGECVDVISVIDVRCHGDRRADRPTTAITAQLSRTIVTARGVCQT